MPRSRVRLKQFGVRVNGVLIRKTFASKAEARRWQRSQKELQDQIRSGSKKHLNPTLLSVHAHEFVKSRKGQASYGHQEAWMGKYILARKESNDKLLHECDKAFWKEIFGETGELVLKHGLAPATHNHIRAMIHTMYEYARREFAPPRAIENPIHDIRPLKIPKKKLQILATKEEIARYVRAAQQYLTHPGWAIFVAIKLNSGLRQQNIIPLRWKDWDPARGVLAIREKYVRTKTFTGFLPGSKSNEDERVVGVNNALRKALEDWKRVTPYPKPDDFIAVNSEGQHLSQKQIWMANLKTLKTAGLPYLSEHKLRHSYASHYLASGGNIHDLKVNLFHANIATTEIYSHALDEELARRAGVFQVETADAGADEGKGGPDDQE